MRSKLTLLAVLMISMLVIIVGCQKRQLTKEEAYEEFQKVIAEIDSYTCRAEVEVVGNKSSHNYVFIHSYNKPDNYKLELVSPEHLKGKTIEYKSDKIIVKNPGIKDEIELPNVGENDQNMFIGDFIKNYLQSEGVDIKLSDGSLVLETYIPGEDEYFNKQILYINIKTKQPEKMEIIDSKGMIRFTITYKDFQYEK